LLESLDVNPRRCLFCGTPIHLCMGFVLARDSVVIMQDALAGRRPTIKARELCGKCVFIWDRIADKMEADHGRA
jgi:hypothetical protein